MAKEIKCEACGTIIPPRRLAAVPGTKYCVGCVDEFVDEAPDPEEVCAKSSITGRNGFAASD